MENKKFDFNDCNLFQFLSICIWMESEMCLIDNNTGGMEVVLREPLCATKIRILIQNKERICFYTDYGQFDFSMACFSKLCRLAEAIINKLVIAEDFDCRNFQRKYLALWLSRKLPAYVREEIDYCYLGELLVGEASGLLELERAENVRALRGQLDIDQEKQRFSNSIGQTNSSRLHDCLKQIQERGYPFQEEYIILYNDDIKIRDGVHRAACLYYLYGNIKIPVKRLYFDWRRLFGRGYVFPFERMIKPEGMKGSVRVILYGAGNVGKTFVSQIRQAEYTIQIVLWVDRAYKGMNIAQVENPDKICQVEFDYVVIALSDKTEAEKVRETLKGMSVEDSKIVWQEYYQA